MELQENQIPEEENIDYTLELLPELLDKSTELEPKMDWEEIDIQAYTNVLNHKKAFFESCKMQRNTLIQHALTVSLKEYKIL